MMNNNPTENMGTLFDQEKPPHDGQAREKLNKVPVEEEVLQTSEPVEVQPEPESKENAGEILKRERKAQGLSLDIVHEAIKIPMDALRAIEEGYKVRMLSPFYYKGFLKMYADYLGIDASQVVEDYHEEKLPKHIEREAEEFEISQRIANLLTRKRKQQIVVAIGIFLALFLFFKVIGFLIGLGSRPSETKGNVKAKAVKTEVVKKETVKKAASKKEIKKIVKAKPVVVQKRVKKVVQKESPKPETPIVVKKIEKKVQPPPTPKPARIVPAVIPVATVQKEITLTVRAKQNSWLRVKADGSIVFQSTLRRGAIETWTADNEVEISGKNIDQLEFELNGKMIGTLGRKDRNAKKVVITKNGLSVKN